MKYFYDAASKTIYAARDQPDILLTGQKNDSPGIWKVWATIEIARKGEGCDGSLNKCPIEQYLASRDTREDAIRNYVRSHYPKYPTIDYSQYSALRQDYCQGNY